jgi:REP element-mobilizing transposase RayT
MTRARIRQLEAYLDNGRGECHLKQLSIGTLVEQALVFFNRKRYELDSWVVMPNHVHVLLTQRDEPLRKVIAGWKSYTAKEANRVLGRIGQFWAEDYWDTYMRNEEHTMRTRRYIENNPVQARLVLDPAQWAWSSARFRDAFGHLEDQFQRSGPSTPAELSRQDVLVPRTAGVPPA